MILREKIELYAFGAVVIVGLPAMVLLSRWLAG